MELTKHEIEAATMTFNGAPAGITTTEAMLLACRAVKSMQPPARAASAVDQGLRKWGDPPTKEEIKAVWDFEQGGGFPKGNLCDYGAIESVVCKWQELRAAALARQAQDGPKMSGTMQDEVRITESTQEPSQHCPACTILGQSLEAGEGTHREGTVEHPAPSQQDDLAAAADPKTGTWEDPLLWERKYRRDEKGNMIPVKPAAPAPVQPSTEDVVERTLDLLSTNATESIPAAEHDEHVHEAWTRGKAAALAVAREGWHSWESVEKAIRKVRVTGNEIGWNTERVTVREMPGGIWRTDKDGEAQASCVSKTVAEWVAAGLRAELDAQGGNKQ